MRIVGPVTLAASGLALALVPLPVQAAEGLSLFPEPRLLAVNIGIFLALIYPIDRLLLRPLVRVLEQRELRTRGVLARAEAVAQQAAELRREFEARLQEARHRAAERRLVILAEGEREDAATLEGARSQAASVLESVRRGIEAELEAARQGLQADAAELGREAAGRILGRPL
ncbi:MAG: hypothetical protein ACE5IL_14460 [Myxococcota bacterium]